MNLIPETKFIMTMRESETWTFLKKVYLAILTWTRRIIWGDRVGFHHDYTFIADVQIVFLSSFFDSKAP